MLFDFCSNIIFLSGFLLVLSFRFCVVSILVPFRLSVAVFVSQSFFLVCFSSLVFLFALYFFLIVVYRFVYGFVERNFFCFSFQFFCVSMFLCVLYCFVCLGCEGEEFDLNVYYAMLLHASLQKIL